VIGMNLAVAYMGGEIQGMADSKKDVLVKRVTTHNGHGVASLIRETDQDGGVTEHLLMLNSRMIDAIFERRQIDSTHHQAATELRDMYERGKPLMGALPARDAGQPMGGGGDRSWLSDEDAWRSYITASRQVRQWWGIIRHVVVEDRSPQEYGRAHRCDGIVTLKAALDVLARHFGLDARRR
jgi:hypothetical protein